MWPPPPTGGAVTGSGRYQEAVGSEPPIGWQPGTKDWYSKQQQQNWSQPSLNWSQQSPQVPPIGAMPATAMSPRGRGTVAEINVHINSSTPGVSGPRAPYVQSPPVNDQLAWPMQTETSSPRRSSVQYTAEAAQSPRQGYRATPSIKFEQKNNQGGVMVMPTLRLDGLRREEGWRDPALLPGRPEGNQSPSHARGYSPVSARSRSVLVTSPNYQVASPTASSAYRGVSPIARMSSTSSANGALIAATQSLPVRKESFSRTSPLTPTTADCTPARTTADASTQVEEVVNCTDTLQSGIICDCGSAIPKNARICMNCGKLRPSSLRQRILVFASVGLHSSMAVPSALSVERSGQKPLKRHTGSKQAQILQRRNAFAVR